MSSGIRKADVSFSTVRSPVSSVHLQFGRFCFLFPGIRPMSCCSVLCRPIESSWVFYRPTSVHVQEKPVSVVDTFLIAFTWYQMLLEKSSFFLFFYQDIFLGIALNLSRTIHRHLILDWSFFLYGSALAPVCCNAPRLTPVLNIVGLCLGPMPWCAMPCAVDLFNVDLQKSQIDSK